MPIIGNVGRRSFKVRALNISIHLVLLLGSVTMIYPFLIMISGSFKSSIDFKDFTVVPGYFTSSAQLFRKHLYTKYNALSTLEMANLKFPANTVEDVNPPPVYRQPQADDYAEFLDGEGKSLPDRFHTLGMVSEQGVYPYMLREFRSWLKGRYGAGEAGVKKLNAAFGTEFNDWGEVGVNPEKYFERKSVGKYTGFLACFDEFKRSRGGLLFNNYLDIDGYFIEILRRDVGKSLETVNAKLGTDFKSWQDVVVPASYPAGNPALAKQWEIFVRGDLALQYIDVGPSALKSYQDFLKPKYANSIDNLNKVYGASYRSFAEVAMPVETPLEGDLRVDWDNFIAEKAPLGAITLKGVGSYFRDFLRRKYVDLQELNRRYARGHGSFDLAPLPATCPAENIAFAKDWRDFVVSLPVELTGLDRQSSFIFREALEGYHLKDGKPDYAAMSQAYLKQIKSRDDLPFFQRLPASAPETLRQDYARALHDPRLASHLVLADPSRHVQAWSGFLAKRHGDIAELNRTHGLEYPSWDAIPVPTLALEWSLFKKNETFLFREFLKRNYVMVFDTLILNGYAAVNTVIYCLLSVLVCLIVNPMAAYALSRFKPPSTYKILLILMMTMAFPPMVLGIPQFLLIKEMGLLNTFAALILPCAANGYSIFLLKGFFDSQPKELFECATLDGASEWKMFIHIAMSLSKPILAVIALSAFTAAYGNFMMAFILCQDKSMWTMMVYLYQLQQTSSQAVGFAALLVAAIPTFLVFVFCQNLIIRGIVVPTEK